MLNIVAYTNIAKTLEIGKNKFGEKVSVLCLEAQGNKNDND